MYTLANILWAIVVILVVLWLLGFVLNLAPGLGGIIHILIVVAVIIVIYNLLVGRRTV